MLLLKLERVDGEYILRIPKDQVLQHDLREGQLLAVAVEALSEFNTIAIEEREETAQRWKLNDGGQRYEP